MPRERARVKKKSTHQKKKRLITATFTFVAVILFHSTAFFDFASCLPFLRGHGFDSFVEKTWEFSILAAAQRWIQIAFDTWNGSLARAFVGWSSRKTRRVEILSIKKRFQLLARLWTARGGQIDHLEHNRTRRVEEANYLAALSGKWINFTKGIVYSLTSSEREGLASCKGCWRGRSQVQ